MPQLLLFLQQMFLPTETRAGAGLQCAGCSRGTYGLSLVRTLSNDRAGHARDHLPTSAPSTLPRACAKSKRVVSPSLQGHPRTAWVAQEFRRPSEGALCTLSLLWEVPGALSRPLSSLKSLSKKLECLGLSGAAAPDSRRRVLPAQGWQEALRLGRESARGFYPGHARCSCHPGRAMGSLGSLFPGALSELTSSLTDLLDESVAWSPVRPGTGRGRQANLAAGAWGLASFPRLAVGLCRARSPLSRGKRRPHYLLDADSQIDCKSQT